MWIEVRIPRSRRRCGRLSARAAAGGSLLRPACLAVALSDSAVAAGVGNPENDPLRPGGPPPFGRYRLSQLLPTRGLTAEARAEYGPAVLAFEPLDGDAAMAESYGRLLLLVHGGDAGDDGRLRPTTGGVRLADADIRALADLARGARPHDVTLVLTPLFPLWALVLPRVSQTGARPVPPPLPGVWGAAPPRPAPRPAREREDEDDRWRRSDWDSRSDARTEDTPGFRAGGGAFGGGGASASWGGGRAGEAAAGAAGAASLGALGALAAGQLGSEAGAGEGAGAAAGDLGAAGSGAAESGAAGSGLADSGMADSASADSGTADAGTADSGAAERADAGTAY
jgi:uncharacterized membrane protein YgcG